MDKEEQTKYKVKTKKENNRNQSRNLWNTKEHISETEDYRTEKIGKTDTNNSTQTNQ